MPARLKAAWALGFAGLAAIVLWVAGDQWLQGELKRIEREIQAGQVGSARSRLSRLSALRLGGVEAQYWRGACEEAEGRVDAALATWAAIPHDSSRYANASLRRARLAMGQGRFAEVEEALAPTRFPRSSQAFVMRESLWQQVDLFTGQFDSLKKRIEGEWDDAGNPAEILRKHYLVDNPRSFPVDALRSRLDEAGRLAPDDDRVWLGKAHLAIRIARFADADSWLRRCLQERPKDPVVWRARLEWAMATDRLTEAVESLRHLPADRLAPEQQLATRAWMAARLGDTRAEQDALTRWVARVPGELNAFGRLITLMARSGSPREVAELRHRKARLDRASDDYRGALADRIPTGGFAELGRLAEELGRWFEARGWWTLALRQSGGTEEPGAALGRIDQIERGLAASDQAAIGSRPVTLADALSDLLPHNISEGAVAQSHAVLPIFRDDAETSGLRFIYENDPTPLSRLPESMGGGVGLIDYDGDGWLDVYAVQGGKLPNDPNPPPVPQGDRLFRNRGDGKFEDVTASAGLLAFPGGYGHGVTVADYDNDGHPDLLVTRWRSYALYRNRGDGTFEDRTTEAGLGGNRDWPASAAFADLDGDGDLDLYVCHYADWDAQHSPLCPHPNDPHRYTYCGPRTFAAMPDHVFRNDTGRFVDVSESAGIRAADRDGRGLGVVAAHLDDDDRIDLFVANDMSANFLFRNRGGFRFEETAAESGVATSTSGGYLAGMGVACGDLDGDGRLDLAVTNFYGESTTFYRNLGDGQFADRTAAVGLAAPSRYLLGFGAAFLDADDDGRLDLATANGHVNDLRPLLPYAMPAQLLLGEASGRLVDVSQRVGPPWQVPRLGRGLACGDMDNDGRLDLLIVSERTPLAYFHNEGPSGHSITLQLEGAPPRSNRDAVGARLTLVAGGRRQVAERIGGSSYLSANDHRLHFGLGDSSHVESIEVRWPSGRVDRYTDLAADRGYRLREGATTPKALFSGISRGDAEKTKTFHAETQRAAETQRSGATELSRPDGR
jgi:tetratricopeptide (TPR) repeat protein